MKSLIHLQCLNTSQYSCKTDSPSREAIHNVYKLPRIDLAIQSSTAQPVSWPNSLCSRPPVKKTTSLGPSSTSKTSTIFHRVGRNTKGTHEGLTTGRAIHQTFYGARNSRNRKNGGVINNKQKQNDIIIILNDIRRTIFTA